MTPEQHREICDILRQIHQGAEDERLQLLRIAKALEATVREAKETKSLIDDTLSDLRFIINQAIEMMDGESGGDREKYRHPELD